MITLFRSVLTEFELGVFVAQLKLGRAKNVNNKNQKFKNQYKNQNLANFANFRNYVENRDNYRVLNYYCVFVSIPSLRQLDKYGL